MLTKRARRILEIAVEIQELTVELQELLLEEEAAELRETKKAPELAVGERVVITVSDRYQGRTGTVRARRGNWFWYVELDEAKGEPKTLIYKMAKSLFVLA